MSSDDGLTWDADHATDRDLYTAAATLTNRNDESGWLKLEFDKTYFIHKVVIYHRFYTDWYNHAYYCAQSFANFQTCVDSGNNVDVSVYQGDVQQKSCGTLKLTYGLEQSDQIYTLVCDTQGDTVILSKNTADYIAVCEVAVLVTQGDFKNFSISKNCCFCPIPQEGSASISVTENKLLTSITSDMFHLNIKTKYLQNVTVSTRYSFPDLSIFHQSYQYSLELFSL